MKRLLLLLWLATIGCTIAGCAAKDQNGNRKTTAATNANGAADSAPAKADAVFAREAVEGLLNGDPAVASALDWENLKVLGADAGRAYRELPDEQERKDVREGFIEEFSESFKASGANVGELKNWREQGKQGDTTVVAVDTKTGKTMRVYVVRRDGRQQISELAIE